MHNNLILIVWWLHVIRKLIIKIPGMIIISRSSLLKLKPPANCRFGVCSQVEKSFNYRPRPLCWLLTCNEYVCRSSRYHSFIPNTSIAPFQVIYYSEALQTQHRMLLCHSFRTKQHGIQKLLVVVRQRAHQRYLLSRAITDPSSCKNINRHINFSIRAIAIPSGTVGLHGQRKQKSFKFACSLQCIYNNSW